MNINIDPQMENLTEKIIGAAFVVSNTLGHGFLEIVYKNALIEELSAISLKAVKEQNFRVAYRGKHVGVYCADIVVENKVIVELKAVESLATAHTAQLLNYLKTSQLPIGLLLNFGKPRIEVKRVIL